MSSPKYHEGLVNIVKMLGESFSQIFDETFSSSNALQKNKVHVPEIAENASDEQKGIAFSEAMQTLASLDISLDSEDMEAFAKFFSRLYGDGEGYRHKYSIIYTAIMKNFCTDENGSLDNGVPPRARMLSENIFQIEQFMASREEYSSLEAYKSVRKLQDHIELEHGRMQYMTLQNKVHMEEIEALRDETINSIGLAQESLNERIKCAEDTFNESIEETKADYETKTMDEIEKLNKSLQKSYVTILGIFAAIVIAFMSDAVFANSILDNIANASIHRLSFVMLSLGFFIFNLLIALFYFILRVSDLELGGYAKQFVFGIDVAIVSGIIFVVADRMFHFLPLT